MSSTTTQTNTTTDAFTGTENVASKSTTKIVKYTRTMSLHIEVPFFLMSLVMSTRRKRIIRHSGTRLTWPPLMPRTVDLIYEQTFQLGHIRRKKQPDRSLVVYLYLFMVLRHKHARSLYTIAIKIVVYTCSLTFLTSPMLHVTVISDNQNNWTDYGVLL